MDDSLKWGIGDDSFVKGPLLSNIFNNCKIKLALWSIRMSVFDLVRLFLGTYSCHDRMAMFKENVQDMRCNEATPTC